MEQLSNPKTLLADADRNRMADFVSPNLPQDPKQSDVETAWSRISRVELDPDILSKNGVCGLTVGTALRPIDTLRTRLILHMAEKGYRRVGITSPLRGSGRTTIVSNLTLSLSRRHDLRSFVFDFDLSKPDLIKRFGLEDIGPKFSALEYERRHFDTNCMRISENLGLSGHSTPFDGSAELLASRNSRRLIQQLEDDFEPDVMLFDMPPLLENDDGMAMLDMLDAALIVVRADETSIEQTDLAERMVAERTNCLGVVLNDCRFTDSF